MTHQEVTRLAPSPTGALHLGNARTFMVNWALARQRGWSIVLRIEDLDTPRIKPGTVDAVIETLRWLGVDWDDGPFVQSRDLEPCRRAVRTLAREGLAYPSTLTRSEIAQAASAPQEGAHDVPFPPHLRPPLGPRTFDDSIDGTNWRFAIPADEVRFADAFVGPQVRTPAQSVGDFVLWTKAGLPSYQLAVVVDDHRQGVTQVVRGDDLLDSAARQLLLYRSLGLRPEPTYTHLPLVLGPDGRRLAKRHGDTRVDHYRERGVPAEAVIGLIAHWCKPAGAAAGPDPITAQGFLKSFNLSTMSHEPVVFQTEHDAWLLSHAR